MHTHAHRRTQQRIRILCTLLIVKMFVLLLVLARHEFSDAVRQLAHATY